MSVANATATTIADLLKASGAFPRTLRCLYVREWPAAATDCARFPTLIPTRHCRLPGLMTEESERYL